jgi:glycosyltransferase involved in cell wall biosynthesis
LVESFDARPERIHVIRSSALLQDTQESGASWRARLDLGGNDLAVCMLAHLTPGKDHATVLRSWRLVIDRLAGRGPRPVLLLAGRDAGTGNAMRHLAHSLALDDQVRFLGEVADVRGLLEASDLAVFASWRELLPRGVTEPMAAGLAVAATDEPGTREAVGGPGGHLLAPPGDASALAEVLVELASDEEMRAGIGRANAELIRSRQAPELTSARFATLVMDALACDRHLVRVDDRHCG